MLLGAQRSGTSVTSHMLSKFGIDFGDSKNFLQADHNPIFFELKWINQYNDRLLRHLGYKYIDPVLPTEADYDKPQLIEMSRELPTLIQYEWPDASKIGIKDPRISLTFPIWQQALSAQGYSLKIIFVFRHPGDFLRSNQRLFQNWTGWDETRHLHFWLRLTLAALYFTRDYPICFVNYDDMMADPLAVAQRFAETFDFDEAQVNPAAAVVDRAQHHHKQFAPTGHALIDHYYDRLCSHQLSGADYLSYRRWCANPDQQTEVNLRSLA